MMDAIGQRQQKSLIEISVENAKVTDQQTSENSQNEDEEPDEDTINSQYEESSQNDDGEAEEEIIKKNDEPKVEAHFSCCLIDESISKELTNNILDDTREVEKDFCSGTDISNFKDDSFDAAPQKKEAVNQQNKPTVTAEAENTLHKIELAINQKLTIENHNETSTQKCNDYDYERKHQIVDETINKLHVDESNSPENVNTDEYDFTKNGGDSSHSSDGGSTQKVDSTISNNIKEESRDSFNLREYQKLSSIDRQFPQTIIHEALWKCKEEREDLIDEEESIQNPSYRKNLNLEKTISVDEETCKLNGESHAIPISHDGQLACVNAKTIDISSESIEVFETEDMNGLTSLTEDEETRIEEKEGEEKEYESASVLPDSLPNSKDISTSSISDSFDKNISNQDDDASRSSTSSTSSSSSSSTSSSASSRNLVIDHPLDELECQPEQLNDCKATRDNQKSHDDECSRLKRKRSEDHESNSPINKIPYLDTSPVDVQDSNEISKHLLEMPVEDHTVVASLSQKIKSPPQAEFLAPSEQPSYAVLSMKYKSKTTSTTSLGNSSLPNISSSARNALLSVSSPNRRSLPSQCPDGPSVNPFNEFITNPAERQLIGQHQIKYDCFKCKSVSFDSFMELRNHHRECIFSKNNLAVSSSASDQQRRQFVNDLPISHQQSQETKQIYMCSSCGTYHENWNLFLHIREIHNRHICLYCIRLFPTAEKLSLHLEIKHDLEQIHFNSENALRSSSGGYTRFLMCCTCQHVFSEHEHFSDHICAEYIKSCTLCGLKGRHTNQCKSNPERQPKVKKKQKQILPERRTANSSTPSMASFSISGKNNNTRTKEATPLSLQFQPSTSLITSQQMYQPTNSHCDKPFFSSSSNDTIAFSKPEQQIKINGCFQTEQLTPRLSSSAVTESSYRLSDNSRPLSSMSQTSLKSDPKKLDVHSDDSDSSNMVIDESCINTYNHDGSTPILTSFKKPDQTVQQMEQQNLERDESGRIALMFGRSEGSEIKDIPQHLPLIVPKFKLRVPKEFQKSVESEVSSTETDEEEEDQDEIESENFLDNNLKIEAPILANCLRNGVNDFRSEAESEIKIQDKDQVESAINLESAQQINDEDSADESNTNLIRILAEIERTKLDIKRTKETLRSNVPADNKDKSVMSCSGPLEKRSPTPSASPDSAWGSPQRVEGEDEEDKVSTQDENILEEEKQQQQQEEQQAQQMETNPEATECDKEINLESIDRSEPEPDHKTDAEILESIPDADGIEVADEDVQLTDLLLDRPLEKFEIIELVRICLKAVFPYCLYCNHARRIAVNGHSLVLHLIAQHRFAATVDSITAEELLPSTIVSKLKSFLPTLTDHYLNSNSYCTFGDGAFVQPFNERIFECFQCRFVTSTHKELYLHNRKMHLKTAILCFMCRSNFFSFSEVLCHICPGAPNKTTIFDLKFRCCLCDFDKIPSPFRLMVHLRKKHFACDVCLEDCRDQGRLSSHVWKHKLHHLCYRCGIAYRNKMDITKHLFWKHGTESIICKRCLQKRWRHVYHFCIPPITFVCDVCNLSFSKATYLKVHKRIHTGDIPYPCTEDNCDRKFVSRRLLLKHNLEHNPLLPPPPAGLSHSPHSGDTQNTNGGDVKREDSYQSKIHVEVNGLLKQDESRLKEEKMPEGEKGFGDGGTIANENDESKKIETDTLLKAKVVDTPRKKKKRHRNKESLEDLNLIAPNLSESDSSDGSDISENKSKSGDCESLVPKVILSPPSETEMDVDHEKEGNTSESGKILDIWKNFKSFQASQRDGTQMTDDEDTEMLLSTPILHVASSDHDYCALFKIRTETTNTIASKEKRKSISPTKRKQKSPRKKSRSGSSSSDSSSGSDSSCSCGSNCSCSSSDSSGSSSSSSDGNDSDSSTSEGRRRIADKKAKKDVGRQRKRSEESSMKNSSSEHIVVDDDKDATNVADFVPLPSQTRNEPLFHESDLDTAESETDEEFYDEHPQKLASELLAQKRLQLLAQTRLSPSHNYDIVENSRPSTPSLPEEIAKEKKVRLKKKKRDRKSSGKTSKMNVSVGEFPAPTHLVPMVQQHHQLPTIMPHHSSSMQVPEVDLIPPYDLIASPGVAEVPNVAHHPPSLLSSMHHHHTPTPIYNNNIHQIAQKPMPSILTARTVPSQSRLSEGSSCSDADGSLKRSKRARRPNKFYGYTSDDENIGSPIMIGMRAFKPQPPPQLTWRKEDLPTPSKSILLNKNKTPRNPKTSKEGTSIAGNSIDPNHISPDLNSIGKKKRPHSRKNPSSLSETIKPRKRPANKLDRTLPPIPTLKIRPSDIGITQPPLAPPPPPPSNHMAQVSQIYSSSKESDDTSESSSDDDNENENSFQQQQQQPQANTSWSSSLPPPAPVATIAHATTPQLSAMMHQHHHQHNVAPPATLLPAAPVTQPQLPPVPEPPMAVAFNHKIPPALLPNPDFATLQYFKRNNIRYPIRPPAGARQPREGESVYCYCRCPYDEVSEMIACDGESCLIEWFHFECVGIMVAPQGKWFCAECRPLYSNELYPKM